MNFVNFNKIVVMVLGGTTEPPPVDLGFTVPLF